MEIPTQQKTKIVNDIEGDGESMVISSKNTFKRNKVVNDSDEDGEGIKCYFKICSFLYYCFIFLVNSRQSFYVHKANPCCLRYRR